MKYLLAAVCLTVATSVFAQQQPSGLAARQSETGREVSGEPRYTPSGELIRPDDFREWMFVTSGLGMTYNQPTGAARKPNFTNVYVNPSSYRAFMKTGHWPDKTMFILEIRASSSEGSIKKEIGRESCRERV